MRLCNRLLIWCLGLAISIGLCWPASASTRNVVVLFDERVELPGLSLFETDFERTIRANAAEPVEVYREAMDLSRFGSDAYKAYLRDFLRAKYADKRIDVVVAVMAPALDFLLKYRDAIFPGTPMVFCGLDRTQLGTRLLPPDAHGVLVRREFAPTAELVLRLHPGVDKMVVVSGTSEFDTMLLASAQRQFRPLENRVSFTYLSELPLERLLETVSRLAPDSVVLYTTFFQDGAGKPFVPHEVVEEVSARASVPVYGFLDQYLGHGIVGGSLYSFATHGIDAARMVASLLSGGSTPALVEPPANKTMFDWRQMQRWHINEQLLPAGVEIDFLEPSIWRTYRWQILLVTTIMLAQAAFISILMNERRRRQHAEVQSRQRMSELAHVNRHSTAGELTVTIAHELNQPLGSILINTETAELMIKSPAPDLDEIGEILADIRRDDQRASEVIQRLRSLLKKTPFELKDIDLNDVAREAVEFLSALAIARQVDLSSHFSQMPLPINGDRVQLQQVILNLIVNAMDATSGMPSRDRRIKISTARDGNFAELSVSDNGPGIPSDKLKDVFEPFFTTKPNGMGMGLSIAQTIVEAHGGQLSAQNRTAGGAVFGFRLQLATTKDMTAQS